MPHLLHRLKLAILLIAVITLLGTLGYRIAGLSWMDALYQTVVTISTVGYNDLSEGLGVRFFTIIMIGVGTVSIAVLISLITGSVVENQLRDIFGRRRLEKTLRTIEDHVIICGYGRLGRTIAGELARKGIPFVVIEEDPTRADYAREHDVIAVQADATEEETLTDAGIARARGLLTTLGSDAANVYVTLTAKQMHRELKVVAIALDDGARNKLRAAGADDVVSPYVIGGTWMAQSIASPTAADFLKMATGMNPMNFYMDEQRVGARSTLRDKRLMDTPIRRDFGVIVVAVRKSDGSIKTNPSPEMELHEGDVLVSLGEREKLDALKGLAEVGA